MLGRQNNCAEAGFGETVVLGCADTTGIAAAAVILTEIAVFGGEIEAARNDGSALSTGADIEMLPIFKLGIA